MSTHKKKTNIVKMTSQEGPTQNHSSKVNIKMITQKVFRDIKQKELEKLLLEGKNISEIARYFNVGRATVRDRIERFNLEDARETGKIDTEKELKMCILFLQLNGVKKIAKIMHTSPKKVKIVLSKYGLQVLEAGKWTKVVDHIKEKNFDLSISDYLTQVIIGHILGDASLRIMKKGDLSYPDLDFGEYSIYGDFLKSLQFTDITEITDDLVGKFNKATKFISDYPTAIFRFSQGTIENWFKEEWVDFNSSLFNKEGYINIPTDSSENSNPFYYFDTVPSVQIFDFYAKWYPNNKKTVPFDLEITPDILLYWYLDDGSLGTNSFYIATQSFSEKEVDFLSDLLLSAFGLECHTSKTEDGYFNLSISLKKDNLTRFYNYLEKSNPTALALAKKVFPWKFDRYLSFAEVMATR